MSQSLKKGIEALLFLSSRKSVGVTELAETLGVHKSTAFRILDTLVETGIVEKNRDTLKYKLGPEILRLSDRYYKNFNIITAAKPIMERLAEDIDESVHLCVYSNNRAVIIEQILSNSRLVVNARIGNSEPLYCSSVGKCLLAFASEKELDKILSTLTFKEYTGKTITDERDLRGEIEKVRSLGYAMDDGELNADIKCLAVPIFDNRGVCTHSLGTSGAASRMTREKINRIVPLMLKAAKNIADINPPF